MSAHSALPPDIHAFAHAVLARSARVWAERKNITVLPEQFETLATVTLDFLDLPTVHGLATSHAPSMKLAAQTLNRWLDIFAASQVIILFRQIEDLSELSELTLVKQAEAFVTNQIANDRTPKVLLWSPPVDLVTEYYRHRSSGPVAVTLPGGSSPVRYSIDKAAIHRSAKATETEVPEGMSRVRAAGLARFCCPNERAGVKREGANA